MQTITKKDLIQSIRNEMDFDTYTIRTVIDLFLINIIRHIEKGNRIEMRNFGVFSLILRKAKIGRNPNKAEIAIPIPARYQMKFSASKNIKEILHEKQAV